MRKRGRVLIAVMFLSAATFGQVAFQIPLTLTNGADTTRLRIGVNAGSTVQMDTAAALGWYREIPLPPMPPRPFRWTARLLTPPGRDTSFPLGMMSGAEMDFRGYVSPTQVDTFAIRIDGDNTDNYPTIVTWPAGLSAHATSWSIRPQSGKGWPVTDMIAGASVTIPPHADKQILIIKKGASGTNAIGAQNNAAPGFHLAQNYPNPFNPKTVVGFQLAVSSIVHMVVYDVLGREVARLVDAVLPAGEHTATFDATNCASGVYLYRLQAGSMTAVKRMMVIK